MYFYTVYGCVVDTLAEDNYVSFAFCLSVRAYVLPHSLHCILSLFHPSCFPFSLIRSLCVFLLYKRAPARAYIAFSFIRLLFYMDFSFSRIYNIT